MRDFAYHRCASLEEASRLAAEPGAMLLAGGQTLLRDMKRGHYSPASLVDIGGILPREIALRDGAIVIGAGAIHAEVAGSDVLQQHLPVLAALVDHIGDPAVRNRGTLGGALAANEPAGDYPAACLALGAAVHTTARIIAASDFFVAESVLAPGEIITAATFPIPRHGAYIKFLNPAARYAMVGVFAAYADGRAAIAVTGAGARGAFRWQEAETALVAGFVPDNLRGIRLAQANLAADLFADAAYRSHLAGVLACRAVELARRGGAVVVLSHGAPVADPASIQ
jgi:aerobic carbon-monoxide dehydrogenase medium subunit